MDSEGIAKGYYGLCRALVIQVLAGSTGKKVANELKDDEAAIMTDFLSEMLDDKQNSLSQRDKRHTLYLLVRLAKSAQVFPQSLELKSVQCDLRKHVTGGGFGFIYKGSLGGKSICVKAVHVQEGGIDKSKIRAHAGELILLGHLSHPNVLPFSGIYFSEEVPPRVCIVSPWMEYGNLVQYLQLCPDAPPLPLVHDIISGLKYLHDFDIVHADLKAQNVLVSEAGRGMLADFGISRVMVTAAATTAMSATGTANWTAPELFLEDPTPRRESDIWSFGCVCYEIITGGTKPFEQFRTVPQLIGAFVKGRTIPPKPALDEDEDEDEWDDEKEQIWSIGEQCWKREPKERPTAGELEKYIAGLGFSDDRAPEHGYSRPKTDSKIDYYRIFEILCQIRRNSRDTSSRTTDDGSSFEEQLMDQLIEVQRQAQKVDAENKDLKGRVKTRR